MKLTVLLLAATMATVMAFDNLPIPYSPDPTRIDGDRPFIFKAPWSKRQIPYSPDPTRIDGDTPFIFKAPLSKRQIPYSPDPTRIDGDRPFIFKAPWSKRQVQTGPFPQDTFAWYGKRQKQHMNKTGSIDFPGAIDLGLNFPFNPISKRQVPMFDLLPATGADRPSNSKRQVPMFDLLPATGADRPSNSKRQMQLGPATQDWLQKLRKAKLDGSSDDSTDKSGNDDFPGAIDLGLNFPFNPISKRQVPMFDLVPPTDADRPSNSKRQMQLDPATQDWLQKLRKAKLDGSSDDSTDKSGNDDGDKIPIPDNLVSLSDVFGIVSK